MSDPDHDCDPELEATIRTGLADLVADGPDPVSRRERIDRRVADRRERLVRRRQFLAGAAVTTVAVGAGITWGLGRSRDDSSTAVIAGGPTSGRTHRSEDDWVRIAPAPLSDRRGVLTTWAGDRLMVWGGVTGTGTPSDGLGSPSDGAVWLAAEERWQTISPAPAGMTEGAFAVWNGTEVLVGPLEADSQAPWNHDVSAGEAQYGLAAYDLSADSWRYVGPMGTDPVRARQATLVGTRLLIADRAARSDRFLGPLPMYLVDPATGATGGPISAGPFQESPYPDGSGEVTITAIDRWVVGITNWDLQPWVLDLDRVSWRQAPGPPDTDSLHLMPATAIGDRVVVRESSGPRMWLFDPAVDGEEAWQPVERNPFAPAPWGYNPVWSGTELFVPGAAYDPATDTWREVAAPPRGPDRQRSLQAHWTGDALLLFGGEEHTCPDGADCDREPGPDTLDGWLLRDP